MGTFQDLFRSGNHNVFKQAGHYIKGLFQADKRNMERMAEVVPDSDDQALQNFLTHSSWLARPVMDRAALAADQCFEGAEGTALIIDESGFAKSGKHSVGVARQWNGRLGKVDNCQVGVFGALGKGDRVALIDARLYLPHAWTDDAERCEKADVPRDCRSYRTKPELALEIVRHARSLGVRFDWVGFDGLYGNASHLLRALDADGERFMADVHKDQQIYVDDPQPYLPERKQGKGRPITRYQSQAQAIQAQEWAAQQPEPAWQRLTLRDTCRGSLTIEVLHQRVWLWEAGSDTAYQWHLLVRRELDSPDEIKYSLSNAPAQTAVSTLAHQQAQRYWVERAFQDHKSHIGLAHYQARKWQSWHRHMALAMIAGLFMLQQRMTHEESYPLLSCYDIQILLAKSLPNKQTDFAVLLAQVKERHRRRLSAIRSASKKNETVQNE
ncbi:IS701 family transposase [Methylotuvimicrobium sp. KM2]|uniref:IS701 family transposase n=1 Tax=Methylotuvimicrobium sp. KM2 TaxID=3133976 RepID=UPI00310111DD